MARLRLPLLFVAPLVAATASAQQVVGTLNVVRQVKVTTGPHDASPNYVDAHDGQPIRNRYGVRTLRRSRAQINFNDHSVLRINERTDVVVLDSASLRNIQLNDGAVWVKVAKGVNTTVTTPTATATARGTEFQVFANGDLFVYEGIVDLHIGGRTVAVTAGNKVTFSNDGKPSEPTKLDPSEKPQGGGAGAGGGGGSQAWFTSVEQEAGEQVTTGPSPEFQSLRTNAVNEFHKDVEDPTLQVIVRGPNQTDLKRELGLVDNTDTNYLFAGLGLAASLALEARNLDTVGAPALSGTAFGYTGLTTFYGVRGNADGSIGDSRYGYEANVVEFTDNPSTKPIGRFGSVLYFERPVAPGLSVYAGRRKFFHGPVFANLADTQLIANRYTGAGFRYDRKVFSAEAAYVYDSNALVRGAQEGALGSVFLKGFGGVLGGHLLETKGLPGEGHGRSLSLSAPVVKNQLEAYGEVGRGIDGHSNQTYGVYFPGFFQKTGVDLFAEYGLKRDVAQSYSLTALYVVPKGPQVRVSLESINGATRLSLGGAIRF